MAKAVGQKPFGQIASRLKRSIDKNNLSARETERERETERNESCNKSALSVKMSILIVDWLPTVATGNWQVATGNWQLAPAAARI